MAIKKSELYSSLWKSCDELRGGMDASQHKDYILTLLFLKYVSDKSAADSDSLIEVPEGCSFDDIAALKGSKEIGEGIDKIIAQLANVNDLRDVIDVTSFNDDEKLGEGREMEVPLAGGLCATSSMASSGAGSCYHSAPEAGARICLRSVRARFRRIREPVHPQER